MIDEHVLEDRLRRTFETVSARATDDVASEPLPFVQPEAQPASRARLLVVSGVAVVVLIAAAIALFGSHRSTSPKVDVSSDSTTTVTQTAPAPASGVYASSRIELRSETLVAGATVHGDLVIANNTGARIAQPDCSALQNWGLYLVNHVASSGPPAYGGGELICNGPPSYLPVGETALPFTFKVTYNECAGPATLPRTLPACLPNSTMPPLPPGDYRVEIDHMPYPSASKPPVITVHVIEPSP